MRARESVCTATLQSSNNFPQASLPHTLHALFRRSHPSSTPLEVAWTRVIDIMGDVNEVTALSLPAILPSPSPLPPLPLLPDLEVDPIALNVAGVRLLDHIRDAKETRALALCGPQSPPPSSSPPAFLTWRRPTIALEVTGARLLDNNKVMSRM